MLALLKLVPLKDWCYGAIIAGLLVGFGIYTHHERVVGEQKVVAADTRAAQRQAAEVAKVETNASTAISTMQSAYNTALAAPVALAPRLVCHSVAPRSSAVPDHAGTSGGSDGKATVPSESSVPFDPSPAVITDARDADAQVTLLQAYITACQTAGICKKN